jgi:hypothetical protein
MYKILQNDIRQLNIGTVQGTLLDSFNIDLSYNKGKIGISPRTRITTNSPTDFGTPVGFVFWDGMWWTVAGGYVWSATSPQGTFTKDTSSGGFYLAPNNCDSRYSDICVFNGYLIVSTLDRVYRKIANGAGTGGWDVIQLSMPVNVVRSLAVFNNRLYFVRLDNIIYSCDTSWAISDTSASAYNFTLPSNYKITFLRGFPTGIYIGTIKTDGTEGFVVDWNGQTKNTSRYEYNIHAQGALAMAVTNSAVYCVNSNAEVLKFNGGGFSRIARLPVKRDTLYNANATGNSGNDRFIHPNGITLIDNYVSLLINGTNNDSGLTSEYNIPSGIWELDDNGTSSCSLNHKWSFSYFPLAGTITDYGQISIKTAGGLAETPDTLNISDAQKGNFIAGAAFYTDATNVGYGTFSDNYYDTEQKAGYFSTVQIRASHFTEMWNTLALLYSPTSGMSAVMKYRIMPSAPVDFTITWLTASTFTTTQVGLAKGDEITIIQGKGSGRVAHISAAPTFSSPNFTVALDEDIINVSGTAKARKQNWTKLGTITKTNQYYNAMNISNPETLIELKVAAVATGETTFDELVLDNTKNK